MRRIADQEYAWISQSMAIPSQQFITVYGAPSRGKYLHCNALFAVWWWLLTSKYLQQFYWLSKVKWREQQPMNAMFTRWFRQTPPWSASQLAEFLIRWHQTVSCGWLWSRRWEVTVQWQWPCPILPMPMPPQPRSLPRSPKPAKMAAAQRAERCCQG